MQPNPVPVREQRLVHMRLILMRHAKAMQRDEHMYGDDSKRPLSKQGVKEHKRVSRMIRDMGISFDHILTSPFDRASETARITRKAYGMEEKPIECNELADDFTVDNLLKKLASFKDDETILLVGHEPYMSTFAASLLWPGHPMNIDFKKSGVMCISFSGRPEKGQGMLEYFLRPRLLKTLRRNRRGKWKERPYIEGGIMGPQKAAKKEKSDKKEEKKEKDEEDDD